MSYRQFQHVLLTATAVAINASGVIAPRQWTPGPYPHVIRNFWGMNTTTLANVSGAVAVLQRVARDVATTATAIATLNFTASGGAGVVFYEDDIQFEVGPGDTLEIDISDAATVAATAIFGMYVEPRWEVAGNATNVKATT